jgi:hypothetical protein
MSQTRRLAAILGPRCAKVRFRQEASTAILIGEARCPPGEAIRGPSRSSTALDPEPTAQTDPLPTIVSLSGNDGPCPISDLNEFRSPALRRSHGRLRATYNSVDFTLQIGAGELPLEVVGVFALPQRAAACPVAADCVA